MKKKNERRVAILLAVMMIFMNFIITPVMAEPGVVAINATNFPDANFLAYVQKLDGDHDGKLSPAEIATVKVIDFTSKKIASLSGIEYFTALQTLHCGNNQLSTLDMSKNTALQSLYCYSNKLTNLDISQNLALQTLDCSSNQLTSLDISNNPSLKILYCQYNQLTSLDISNNPSLIALYCQYNQLTSLDLSNNTKLETLYCGRNQLTILDLSKNINLKALYCGVNQLTTLDLSKNINLKTLDCGMNQLTNLDLSSNTALVAFAGLNQKYNIQVNASTLKFDLRSLPGKFNPSNASGWVGGDVDTVDSNILKLKNDPKPTEVKYNYKVNNGDKKLNVTLNVKYGDVVTVTFNKNGGEGSMKSEVIDKGSTYNLPACTFTPPTGKAFKAWEVGGVEKAVGDSITVNANTTVKAIWKDKTYNVNVSVNPADAGTVTATPNSATFGQKINLTITPNEGYEKENVTLNGTEISGTSFTMPDAEANVVVNFKPDPNKNTELKKFSATTYSSVWASLAFNTSFAPNTREYTASVDKTHTSINFSIIKAVDEQTITVKVNGVEDNSFDYKNHSNWQIKLQPGKNEFEFTVTAADGATKGTYKLTLTRGNISEAYTITVENGKADRKKAFEGDSVNITADDAAAGMVFDKWTSDPKVSIYYLDASSARFEMPASNVTLTANYKPDPETTAYLKDIKVDTKANAGVWKPQALTFKPETSSYTVTVAEDQEKLDLALYLFDKGQKVEVKKGSETMTLDIISSNPTREYLMNDLNKGPNVYKINVKAKTGDKTETYTVTINRGTPAPPPTPKTYTIKFDNNGGEGTMDDVVKKEGDKYPLPACTFTAPTNKEFKAWLVGSEEKAAGETITVNADMTIIAVWKDKTVTPTKYTIKFDNNGGEGTMDDVVKNEGDKYPLPACTFTAPTNKEFKAWLVGSEEKATGETITVNADMTIMAVWTDKTVTPPTPPTPPTPDPDPYTPPYIPDYYDYYDYHRPHRHTEDKKEDKKTEEKPADKPIDKPAEKVETEVIFVIGSNNMDTKINGTDSFKGMDAAPYIKNGRTMLPIRYIAEALGMSVSWDAKTRTVIIGDLFYTVEIPVDTNKIIVNGVEHISDVKPEIVHGRTMLPIANIARALGLVDGKDIIWDASKRQVIIKRIYDKKEN